MTGAGVNPWDRTRWSGGAANGAASAVAAGLVPFALGPATGDSLVMPAAYCGITALRPTFGYVGRGGAMPGSQTLDTIGIFAHTAEDCGHVLQAIAGGDEEDPGSAGRSFYYTPQYARRLPDLKFGYAPADEGALDADARPVYAAAMSAIRASGMQSAEVRLPEFEWAGVLNTIDAAECSSAFEALIAGEKFSQLADPAQIDGLKRGLAIPAKDYLRAMQGRRRAKRLITELFDQVDLIVAPARYETAQKLSQPVEAPPASAMTGMRLLTTAATLTGLPALVLPCGFVGGLPMALQIVGPPFSENTLLAVGRDFASRTEWHRRHPSPES